MGMLVGFERLRVQKLKMAESKLTKDGEQFVIEGKPNQGGTVQAEISGLSKDPKVVSASNIAYYISRKGVNKPKVEFELLDIPQSVETALLGRKETDNGVQLTGEDTEAPYCAIAMESSDAQGNTALVGFFYGVFSKDGETMKTLEEGEDFTPENEKWTFTASANPSTDQTLKGQYMAKYAGAEEAAINEIYEKVLLQDTPKA